MRASQYVGLGIRTVMGNYVSPQSNPGITVLGTGVSVGGAVGSTAVSSSVTSQVWDVTPEPAFVTGDGATYDVAQTGPVDLGYLAGGTYSVDSSGSPLPVGFSFTNEGLLTNESASVSETSGVVFAYDEPISGEALPVLTLYNNTVVGTLPYTVTVFAGEGAVPSGMSLVSPEDPTLRASVLNTWPNGSARTLVVAGQRLWTAQNSSMNISVEAATVSDTPLTLSDISARFVSGITINFPPNGSGAQTLSDFSASSPQYKFTWWANSQVICARYLMDCGLGNMQAAIDVHAFATGHAFVEVVIENCKVNSALSSVPVPANQSYSGATVTINSSVVQTFGMPQALTWAGNPVWVSGTHEGLRAVYIGAWVNPSQVATPIRGASDPFIEIIHDAAYLQALHVFPGKSPRAKTYNAQTSTTVAEFSYTKSGLPNVTQPYRDDLYAPWDIGRNKGAYMGSAGGIRQLPKGDWQYIQGPDRWTRRGVIASTLALHSFPINYRDSTTGNVPTWAQIGAKQRSSADTWPENEAYPDWEGAHQPGYGLTAFLCQPSPCFIELMQKAVCWNGSWTTPVSAPNYAQTRQRAWLLRNCIHALHATPSWHPYKSSIEQSLAGYISYIDQFRTSGRFELGVFMGVTITSQEDARYSPTTGVEGFQAGPWQQTWMMLECVRAHRTKIHSDQATRTLIQTVADWQTTWVINWVNERVAAGSDSWKFICQYPTVGRYSSTTQFFSADPDCFTNWDEADQWSFTDYPPPAVNTWYCSDGAGANYPEQPNNGTKPKYSNYVPFGGSPFYDYAAYQWPGFCAAAESGLPGADAMWNSIKAGILNLGTYLNSTATDPDHKCAWPRNKALDV